VQLALVTMYTAPYFSICLSLSYPWEFVTRSATLSSREGREGGTQCMTWSGLLLQPQCSAHLPLSGALFVYNRLAVGTDNFPAPSIPPNAKVKGQGREKVDSRY